MPNLKNIFSDRSSRWFRLRRFLPSFLTQRRQVTVKRTVFRAQPRLKALLSGRQKLLTVLAVLVLGGLIGLTYFSGFLTVTKVSVLRSSLDLPLAEIEQLVREQAFGQNILQLKTIDLEKQIKILRPDISRVSINKKYPRELQVTVFKYPIVAELRVGTERIFINENGYRVDGEQPDRDTFVLSLGEEIELEDPKQRIVQPEHLQAMRDARFYFEAISEQAVLAVRYFPAAREARIITEKNTDIWLDLTQPSRPQLDKLLTAGDVLDLDNGKYKYIDLRIPGKIFYKTK